MRGLKIRADERDLRNLCRTMIALRAICVGAILTVVAFLTGSGVAIDGVLPVTVLLLAVFPLSAIWWMLLRSGYSLRRLVYFQLVADLVVESGMVFYTGGAQSHLALLFLITIFLASIFLRLRGAVAMASLSALLFAAASGGEYARFHESLGEVGARSATTYLFLNIILQVTFFYMIAVLSGYVSERITAFGAKLRSTASELQRARMDTRSIIESMNSGLVTVDVHRIITEFNVSASKILGIPVGEARGRHIDGVLRPVSPELWGKLVDALECGKEEERGEVGAVTADGSEIPLGLSVSLLRDDGGYRTGVVSVFQDLTEAKRMTERMRLADRLATLGQLSAAMAHEIRTPLASICGSVEMLRDSLKPSGEDRKLVDLVIKESERLREIIDHFLQFARTRPPKFGQVCLNSVLRDVVCMVRNHPRFTPRMSVELDDTSRVEAWVDQETIKQVFYNLALNAIEALGPSGSLRITLSEETYNGCNRSVRVRFEDNGTGIDEADVHRIFEPFFTNKKAGTGLGLAIVSRLIEQHAGTINVQSSKGLGTVVTVELPLDIAGKNSDSRGADSSRALVEASNNRVE